MKAILAAIALVGAQAFACPNLTGTFACTYEGQTENTQITQSEMNGVTTYTMRNADDPNDQGGSLPADNNTYTIPDSQEFKQGTIRGWCEGELFKIEQIGQYHDQGQHIGDIQATMTFSLNNNNLNQVTAGVFKTASGEYPINSELTCTRIN